MVSDILINIGLGKGLSPLRCQAIIEKNSGILSIAQGTSSKFEAIQQNAFGNVVCKISAILFRPQNVQANSMPIANALLLDLFHNNFSPSG